MDRKIEWFVFEKRGNIPKYIRTVGKDDTGVIYMPVAIADEREHLIGAMASEDNVKYVVDSGHYYASSEWLSKTFPECKELCEDVERQLLNI